MNAQKALSDITPGQIKKIHALIAAMGFADDFYRDIIWTRYQVRSSKEMTKIQAGQLIEDLEKTAIKGGTWKESAFREKYKSLDGRPGFASIAQLALIESMWAKVSRMETPELKAKSLRAFVSKIAKVSDLRFLDMGGAGKVIIALRQMEKRREHHETKGEGK
ncbi:MAG: regulatory protein GemA [Syntrophales bacterium]|nr:regulatory protein GemA [Syntrophales bacterium]